MAQFQAFGGESRGIQHPEISFDVERFNVLRWTYRRPSSGILVLTLISLTIFLFQGAARSVDGCPQDSVPNENGSGCKCADCPPHKCRPGQQAVLVRGSFSGTPGNCCPRYNCVPSGKRIHKRGLCSRRKIMFTECNEWPCARKTAAERRKLYDSSSINITLFLWLNRTGLKNVRSMIMLTLDNRREKNTLCKKILFNIYWK